MTLTRSAFFAAIGAALARAQQACVPPLWSSTCLKVNGQCPVCGWMAPPYDPKTTLVSDPYAPVERRIDCENCNTTFRQYREGVRR